MKTKHLILLSLIVIGFTACSLSGSVNNTPVIYFMTDPVVNRTVTLQKYYTDESGVYRMDTINVGDTVSFHLLLYGFSNNLTSYYITQSDTASAKLILPSTSSLDSVFSTTASNYYTGKFIFKSKITSLYFPFRYVAKKATNTAKLTFLIVSDANFNNASSSLSSNTYQFSLLTPIIASATPTIEQ